MLAVLLAAAAAQGPGPVTLTLDDALERARAGRGRAAQAAAGVAEARAGERLAGQVPNPLVSFEHTGDTPHQHLLFEQPLAWLATRGAERGAAAAIVRRARADSALVLAELGREVRVAFFGALGAAESLRLVEEQVGLSDSLARIARRRLDAGDISRLEYDQAAQEARRGRQLLSAARERARSADAALVRAIGWTGAAPPALRGALDQELERDPGAALAADSVPAVRGAVADSIAAQLGLRSIRRGRLPIPSLTGGTEWDDPGGPSKALGVIGLAVPLPFWNVGGAQVAIASARATQAAAETREVRLEAGRAVAEARVRLAESAGRARFARDSLIPAARELRERAVTAYRAGETGVLPVLDALRGEREVVLAGVEDLLAFQVAVAEWRALLGRP